MPHPPVLPPVRKSSKTFIPTSPSSVKCEKLLDPDRSSACSSCAQRRKLPSIQDMSERISRLNKSREKVDMQLGSRSRRRVLKPLRNIDKDDRVDTLNSSHEPPLPDIGSASSEVESYKKLLNWMQPKSKERVLENEVNTGLGTVSKSKRNTPELTLSSRLVSIILCLFVSCSRPSCSGYF